YASLRPQTYDAGLGEARDLERFGEAEKVPAGVAMGGAGGFGGGAMAKRMRAPAAPAPMASAATPLAAESLGDRPMNAQASVSSVAPAAKLGELFQYSVGSVSLPRQRSAMIPIITDPVQVERLSFYNQTVLAKP